MPGKHVRFSTQNTYHSSDNSPSRTFTPPSNAFTNLPTSAPHAPRRSYTDPSAGKACAHNLLAQRSTPLLSYDLTLHPSSVTTHYHGLSSASMSEPAVYPPQPTLTIQCSHLPCLGPEIQQWSFTVPASNRRYVTVADVLSSLYHGLRTHITPAEFQALSTPKLMRRVGSAYAARYRRLEGHRGYAHEKASGVRRVDYLMGCNEFRGLTSTSTPGVWRLHVA
ncbi:hypothetical protein FB45DRAFT_844627 [Roridomyces roridus]|uniref:DUF6699 domain-containing protein n=1 Tax=Roridomyces roridus TaxID=1738132 RepID=A0AAD7F9J3_9AGAR|nr:hypothetical protein FB45DRAFT_844627 [Roridomyces roridus]